MDQYRFDDLTKRLSAPASRRSFLGGAIALAAAAFGFGSEARAAAVKRKPGEICRKQGECVTGASCTPDGAGRSRCTCNEGLKACGDACIAVAACCTAADCPDDSNACTVRVCNPNNTCGQQNVANGAECDDGDACTINDSCQTGVCTGAPKCSVCESCTAGVCAPDPAKNNSLCATGICCNGACVDRVTDENNCGTCGTVCPPGITPDLNQVCTADGCCPPNRACNQTCCDLNNGHMCDESESTCCFPEQVCGPSGSQTCCPGTQYCVDNACRASGTACPCASPEVCADGGVCCTPERMCGTTCCSLGFSGCTGTNGDICAAFFPQGGLSRF